MIKQKSLVIDANTKEGQIINIESEEIIGPIDYAMELCSEDDYFVFGRGILGGSIIPGTQRLIFAGMSPMWETFYISTLGGAAIEFYFTGLNYVAIKNKSEKPSVLIINYKDGQTIYRFEEIKEEKISEIFNNYNNKIGTYALQDYVIDIYSNEFSKFRVLTIGPAALKTNGGAIMSSLIENRKATYVDGWAGRGGLGSKLYKEHGICAIIYGGEYTEKISGLTDVSKINELFESQFNKKMMAEVMEATTKYRYESSVKSGGTLGVNFSRVKDWLIYFNWTSVKTTDKERLKVYNDFIVNHYLKQFNEETIKPKQQKTCGEVCPAFCKKMNKEYKKDYEPYQAAGPNSGIFDQRAAEKINHEIDILGLDAIDTGNIIGWIMEGLHIGLFKPEEFGLNELPKFDLKNFDVVNDSNKNAEIALKIINFIIYDEESLARIIRKGVRMATKELNEIHSDRVSEIGVKYNDIALFTSHGNSGCMAPNQYWVPGMFLPMPIMGKYFEYYGADYYSPYELGKKSSERMIKELYSDNTGICRFHRKWVEKLIEKIVNQVYETNINYFEHHKKIVKKIFEKYTRQIFWESERLIDVIYNYLKKIYECEPEDKKPEVKQWMDKFEKNKFEAAKEYWNEAKKGIQEGIK